MVFLLQNIIATPVSKALKIDFQPVKVPPDSKSPTEVAVLTFDCKYNLYEYILCVVYFWLYNPFQMLGNMLSILHVFLHG